MVARATAPGVAVGARRRLGFASAGVLLGAADTYVVVIVLPAIMSAVGLDLAHLDQATPIVSGFLLGYVVVLPLLGRLSDLYGRTPTLVISLLLFAAGSLITASATSLGAVIAGRTLQGLGGGGLVPVTLAMVADLWPAPRRGLPLGVVNAVQELGSVVGPLYGAALGATAGWRAIFYVNLPMAGAIAAGVRQSTRQSGGVGGKRRDTAGWFLATLLAAATVLAVAAPGVLTDSVTLGLLYTPLLAGVSATTPITLLAALAGMGLLVRELAVPAGVRALVPLRRLPQLGHDVDWLGAALAAAVLGLLVVVFASADPAHEVVARTAPLLLPLAALLGALFVAHQLRAPRPLVDLRALRSRAAAGALLTNLAVGAALMAALVDIPVFARATVDADSQTGAALVLARLLVAVPAGALVGGICIGRLDHRLVAASGMLLAAVMFVAMTGWSEASLAGPLLQVSWLHPADPVLLGCGFGFGLAVVPTTSAILGAVPAWFAGVAASLTVAARMIGMLAGLSLLTALGLRHFYTVEAALPSASSLCPRTPLACPAYDRLLTGAVIDELHVIFAGAAVCAGLAAVLAALLLGTARGTMIRPAAVSAP